MKFARLAICMIFSTVILEAQTAEDSAAIRRTALNYVEGWYEANPERMESALHPELAKRIVLVEEKSGKNWLDVMGATKLVNGTRRGGGKNTPKDQQQKDVLSWTSSRIQQVLKQSCQDGLTTCTWRSGTMNGKS